MSKYLAFTKDSNTLQAVALRILAYTIEVLESDAEEDEDKQVVINQDLLPKKKWGGYEFPLNKECRSLSVFNNTDVLAELTDSVLDNLTDDLIYDNRKKDRIEFNVVLLKKGIRCRKPSMLVYWRR